MLFEKKNLFDYIVLWTIILQAFAFNFLGLSKLVNWLILVLIIVRLTDIILKNGIFVKDTKILLCITGFYFTFFMSALLGEFINITSIRRNVTSITYPLMIALYFAFMMHHNKKFLVGFFENSFLFFNLFFVLNCIVLLFQVKNPGFLAGVSDWTNDYEPDLISGLFGYCGTHQLGLYSCFIIIYNLYYSLFVCKKKHRNAVIIYDAALFVYTVIISSKNDNKMFYVLVLLLLLIFYLFIHYNPMNNIKRMKSIICILFLGIIFLIACLLLYNSVGGFKKIIDKSIMSIFTHLVNIFNQKNSLIVGGSERLYMIIFAFTRFNALLWGYGVGTYYWLFSDALGFTQFGQSDLGNFLCLGGLLFTVPCIITYLVLYFNISGICEKQNKWYLRLLVFVLYMIMIVYTLPMKSTSIQILFVFNMVVLGMIMDKVSNEKIKIRKCRSV